jgi:hypothetical protein
MRLLLGQYLPIHLVYLNGMEPQRRRGLIISSLLYGVLAMLFLFPFCYQSGLVETVVIFGLRVLLCNDSMI